MDRRAESQLFSAHEYKRNKMKLQIEWRAQLETEGRTGIEKAL